MGRSDHRLGILVAFVLQVEKVDARRRPVQEHLGERERGADVDPIAIEARGEGIEHAVAPLHEVEVITEAAQQRLKGVAMRVDGAG